MLPVRCLLMFTVFIQLLFLWPLQTQAESRSIIRLTASNTGHVLCRIEHFLHCGHLFVCSRGLSTEWMIPNKPSRISSATWTDEMLQHQQQQHQQQYQQPHRSVCASNVKSCQVPSLTVTWSVTSSRWWALITEDRLAGVCDNDDDDDDDDDAGRTRWWRELIGELVSRWRNGVTAAGACSSNTSLTPESASATQYSSNSKRITISLWRIRFISSFLHPHYNSLPSTPTVFTFTRQIIN